jgi:hypothetical protein
LGGGLQIQVCLKSGKSPLLQVDGLIMPSLVELCAPHLVHALVVGAEFEGFAEEYPEVYKSLVKLLARRLRDTDTVVAASSFLSLKGRVARTMLELAGHFGQEVAPGRIVAKNATSMR